MLIDAVLFMWYALFECIKDTLYFNHKITPGELVFSLYPAPIQWSKIHSKYTVLLLTCTVVTYNKNENLSNKNTFSIEM